MCEQIPLSTIIKNSLSYVKTEEQEEQESTWSSIRRRTFNACDANHLLKWRAPPAWLAPCEQNEHSADLSCQLKQEFLSLAVVHQPRHPEGSKVSVWEDSMNRFKTSKFKNTTPKVAKKDVSSLRAKQGCSQANVSTGN